MNIEDEGKHSQVIGLCMMIMLTDDALNRLLLITVMSLFITFGENHLVKVNNRFYLDDYSMFKGNCSQKRCLSLETMSCRGNIFAKDFLGIIQ